MKTVEEDRSTTTVGLRQLLRALDEQVTRAMRINLDAAGLTPDEWAVICLLADGRGHAMAEVTAAAGVPAPSATRMVDKLVGSALLHRAIDPHDRRKVLVVLSPRGQELHARLAPAHAQIADFLAERIGREELEELQARLGAAARSLRAGS